MSEISSSVRLPRLAIAAFFAVSAAVAVLALLRIGRPGRDGPNDLAAKAYEAGDWATATKYANERLKVEKNDIAALRILARSMARQGKDDLATALYENRVRLDGMESEDRYLLGEIIARQGNGDLALGVWEKALAEDPSHASMTEALAMLSAKKLRLEEAVKAAESLARLPGREPQGQLLSGIFRASMEDWTGSVAAFRKAFEIDPGARTPFMPADRVRRLFVKNLLRTGHPEEALRVVKQASPAEVGSDDGELAWLESRAELAMGKADPASGLSKKSVEFRGRHPLEPEPARLAGEAECTACHAEIARDYSKSRHANSFGRGSALARLPLPDVPVKDPDDPAVFHHFERRGEGVEIVTKKGDQELVRVLAEFVFGTSGRYFTMVGRDGRGTYRAARLSHFTNEGGSGWDRTSGDPGSEGTERDVIGQPVHVRDGVVRCLACHVTSPRDFRADSQEKTAAFADKGLGCESCHGPGSNHLIAAEADFPDLAIRSLTSVDGNGIQRVCADCHTVGDPNEIRATPEDPKWVRSAGVTFPLSRCFTGSGGKLSCVTCHDPHASKPLSMGAFDAKCLNCHSGPAAGKGDAEQSKSLAGCGTGAVNDCVRCHMPKIDVPVLHGTLTDHYIRVRK